MINDIDINDIKVSNKFPLVNKIKYLQIYDYKDNKEVMPLCILFPEITMYKRYSDKTVCISWSKMNKCLINIWQYGRKLAI